MGDDLVNCPRCNGVGHLESADDICFTCNGKCMVTSTYASYMAASMASAEKARLARQKADAERAAAAPPATSRDGTSDGLPHGLHEILKGCRITRIAPGDNVEVNLSDL